jgi:hypothetical protein
MIIKKRIPKESIENGEVVYNFSASQDCSDWLALGRLRRAAEDGDENAKAELLRRENTDNCTIEVIPDDIAE